MSHALIPGSRVYNVPLTVRDVDALTQAEQLRYGIASKSYRWHWRNRFGRSYTPLPKQQEFLDLPQRFTAFVGGAGSGKTITGAAWAVKMAIDHPGSTGLILAPTYKMLKSATRVEFDAMLNRTAVSAKNEQDGRLTLTNGTTIWFRSTESPEGFRGITAAWGWLDEGAYADAEAWRVLVQRLRQPGFPNKAIVTTTPLGMNWVYDKFASPERNDALYNYIRISTRDNTTLGTDYVESMAASFDPEYAQQEIEGEFIAFRGLVYKTFKPDRHVQRFELDEDEVKETLYFHDFGSDHPMVVLVCQVDYDGRMYIVDEWSERHKIDDDMIQQCKEVFYPMYGSGQHIADPAAKLSRAAMERAGLYVQKANNEIQGGVQRVAGRFHSDRLFIHPRCIKLIKGLNRYRYPDEGKGRPDVPIKKDDDEVDALRYGVAYMEDKKSWGSTEVLGGILD